MKHLLSALLSCLMCCGMAAAAPSEAALQDLRRAIDLVDATMQHAFTGSASTLRMYDTYNTQTQQGAGTADVWPYTAAIEAHCSVLEALDALRDDAPELYAATRDRFATRLKQLYDCLDYYRGTYTLYSYAQVRTWSIYGVHRSATRGTAAVTGIENVYDDQMWLCRELIRAYRLTGDDAYLTKAELLANYCIDGWDCCLDPNGQEYGGITWGPGYNSKHACSNAPLIQPLVWLYEIFKTDDEPANLRYFYILPDGTRTNEMRRHSDVYLDFARKIYAWQKKMLYNQSTGVYWDMLGAPGELKYVGEGRNRYRDHVDTGGPTGTAYTYNTGTMLAGAAELWRVTGEDTYLADLNTVSQKSFNYFAKGKRIDGVVFRQWPTDPKAEEGFNTWFDNVLMRAYVDAAPYNTSPTPTALNSFRLNLNYGWEHHLRDGLLPIHLIDGWGDATVTKGFHQMAFASELAMLAVWQQRQAQPDAVPQLPAEASVSPSATEGQLFDLQGRVATRPLRRGLYVLAGHKIQLQ